MKIVSVGKSFLTLRSHPIFIREANWKTCCTLAWVIVESFVPPKWKDHTNWTTYYILALSFQKWKEHTVCGDVKLEKYIVDSLACFL